MPPDSVKRTDGSREPRRAADRDERIRLRSIDRYRGHARGYDASCDRTWGIRERAIAGLALRPGDRVLDVGCGTGLSLPLLQAAVGETGFVYGVEQSPEMAARARDRIESGGWSNVVLVESAAQHLVLPQAVDAVLFNYTHDICQSPRALAAVFACAREGARVSAAGVKFMPWWLAPLNVYAYFKNAAYNGSAAGMRRPWRLLERWVPDLAVRPAQYGMAYLAQGHLAGEATKLSRQ